MSSLLYRPFTVGRSRIPRQVVRSARKRLTHFCASSALCPATCACRLDPTIPVSSITASSPAAGRALFGVEAPQVGNQQQRAAQPTAPEAASTEAYAAPDDDLDLPPLDDDADEVESRAPLPRRGSKAAGLATDQISALPPQTCRLGLMEDLGWEHMRK